LRPGANVPDRPRPRARPRPRTGCVGTRLKPGLRQEPHRLPDSRLQPAPIRRLRDQMKNPLGDGTLNQLFREARTYTAWLDKPVSDEVLRQLYDLMKWGPTSANLSPARILLLRTREAKERLRPALSPGNVDKTMAAPVTAILAY